MAGLNLSSSTAEKKESRAGVFDSSFFIISGIFFLVVAGWGGLRWYMNTLDDKSENLSASLEQNSSKLQGNSVDRVAYFDARLGLITEQSKSNPVDPKELLNQLESLTVPSVRLTKYEYNQTERSVEVAGETENFKYVAQQVISLKSADLFTGIKVNSLKRNDAGRIEFSLKAQF